MTSPSPIQMLEDVAELGVGLVTLLLPLFLLAVPGFALFVVLPAIVLAAVALPVIAVVAVLVGPPYLLVRRRRVWLAITAAPGPDSGADTRRKPANGGGALRIVPERHDS